mmetsp:Transcript_32912/g.69038  ORF Transcript_32912/g.69038 Transcript_32912/m.69038 type:complete len:90 (-) Transcript_32912:379-648(-)
MSFRENAEWLGEDEGAVILPMLSTLRRMVHMASIDNNNVVNNNNSIAVVGREYVTYPRELRGRGYGMWRHFFSLGVLGVYGSGFASQME